VKVSPKLRRAQFDCELARPNGGGSFQSFFPIQMSLVATDLAPAAKSATAVPAQLLIPQRRIFMSEPLFGVPLVVLSLDLIILTFFYSRLPKPFLTRLPTSIARQIAYFAGSHVNDDVRDAGGDLRELDEQGYRYGYGKSIEQDRWVHVGVEREPFVVGLDDAMVEKRRWWGFRPRRQRSL
jgi:hypothetical protein